ncbi:MAG: NAD(+) diphosphatase, partial [Pseudomonadota bacterium]
IEAEEHRLLRRMTEDRCAQRQPGEGEAAPGRYAVDISDWIDPDHPDGPPPGFRDATRNAHPSLPEACKFVDLRSIMGELTTADAADAATARGVLEWHRTHRHCARCGAPSNMDGAGWRRKCPACGAMHFPRTDPVVIMLVTRGDRCLLGRQPPWPPAMYSLLAGFMEPGETLEAATRREVGEESSIPVGRVRYLCSQPWPFPASLMIATHGEALDDRIEIDPNELEDARWATREELREALAGRNPDIGPARPGAVARTVIEAWVDGRIPDFD